MDGLPAGVEITTAQVAEALAQRRLGHGRGARQKFEEDRVQIIGGVRHGKTIGAPIAILIENSEWPKWKVVMNPDPVPPESLLIDAGKGDVREVARNKKLTCPRPGHADFAGMMAYQQDDARQILERASARETATRVALGCFAQEFLAQAAGIKLVSQVRQIGEISLPEDYPLPTPEDGQRLGESPVRCLDQRTAQLMMEAIDQAHRNGDTIGGMVEVIAYQVPVGIGSHTQWDRRLDTVLSAGLMSIQAVKAVEVGSGRQQSALPGSVAHDQFSENSSGQWERTSNLAGGIEGGMSAGGPLRVRAYLKPISTVPRALKTVDLATGKPAQALHQRSDACAVVPAAVIAQAQVALTLADQLLIRFGGYTVKQIQAALEQNNQYIQSRINLA